MIMAAARAGGIIANSTNQKDFFLENIEIQNSLLNLAKQKILKEQFLGTSYIYQNFLKLQLKRKNFLTGKSRKKNKSMLCNS